MRCGASRDDTSIRGLYMNEWDGRAYFTMLRICPFRCKIDPNLWCTPRSVNPKDQDGGRKNYTPKAGQECTALKQLLGC